MKVRDLIEQNIDIDVYDDVCESLAICFCGALKLTEEGMKEFGEVLDYTVELHNDCATVCIDDEEGVWQKKLRKAKRFFESAAGYCADSDYQKWFKED